MLRDVSIPVTLIAPTAAGEAGSHVHSLYDVLMSLPAHVHRTTLHISGGKGSHAEAHMCTHVHMNLQ